MKLTDEQIKYYVIFSSILIVGLVVGMVHLVATINTIQDSIANVDSQEKTITGNLSDDCNAILAALPAQSIPSDTPCD